MVENAGHRGERQRADAGLEAVADDLVGFDKRKAHMVALGAQIAAERGKLAGGDHGDGSGRIVGGKRDTKENGHDFVSLEKSPLSTPFSLELPRAADGRRRGYCPAARGGSMPPSARSEEHTSELQSLKRTSYA